LLNSRHNVANSTSAGARPPLRLILADSQAIFRAGIAKILTSEPYIRVVAQTGDLGQTLAAVSAQDADVLFFEHSLTPAPVEAVGEILKRAPRLRIVVLVDNAVERDTVDYFRRGVRGLITRGIAPALLVRCVHKVAAGETWLDNQGINWLVDAFRTQSAQLRPAEGKHRLREKELLIISGVARGLRNREIGGEIGTSEQVVKNCLRKIYAKLGIKDRLELALYTVHERLLDPRPAVTAGILGPGRPGEPGASPASSPE
jgi:DNA-binding NarL/FixJ family response regulator